jgi:hypothetical protein
MAQPLLAPPLIKGRNRQFVPRYSATAPYRHRLSRTIEGPLGSIVVNSPYLARCEREPDDVLHIDVAKYLDGIAAHFGAIRNDRFCFLGGDYSGDKVSGGRLVRRRNSCQPAANVRFRVTHDVKYAPHER